MTLEALPSESGLRLRNVDMARSAFANQDVNASREFHRKISDEPHKANELRKESKYFMSFVSSSRSGALIACSWIGALSGVFGMFESRSTGPLSKDLFFLISCGLGFALLGGISVARGLVEYFKKTDYSNFYAHERRREIWEYDNYIEGEQREMIELYISKGVVKDDAEEIIKLASKYKRFFVDIMMMEELGLLPPQNQFNYALDGVVTSASSFVVGLLPFLPFGLWLRGSETLRQEFSPQSTILLSFLIGFVTLFIFGLAETKYALIPWWKAGLRMALNGICSSLLAFLFGLLFRQSFLVA